MKNNDKKNLFIIIPICVLVLLFGTAALCNRCGNIAEEESATTTAEEETSEDIEATTTTVDKVETTTTTNVSTTEETTPDISTEATEPTIQLVIYQGPTYADESGVCYYRIRAEITGNPVPNVVFSKDDSLGTLGAARCQVNINNPGETYTLTATSKNAKGEDADSMVLSWGCAETNHDPEIDFFATIISEERYYVNSICVLESHASDPDGDSLDYLWEVSGGTLADPNAQSTTWVMPSSPTDHTVKLTVTDGKGGQDSETVVRRIENLVYSFMDGAPGAYWTTNGNIIPFGGSTSDNRGFATFVNNVTLEDGTLYPRVLETHPKWVNNGWVSGLFPNLSEYIHIPANARFKAKVGFLFGAGATDGAYFRIRFYDGTNWYYFPSGPGIHCAYDGTLNDLDIDLNSIAGKSVQAFLQVDGGASSVQDWAVWVNPIIAK